MVMVVKMMLRTNDDSDGINFVSGTTTPDLSSKEPTLFPLPVIETSRIARF